MRTQPELIKLTADSNGQLALSAEDVAKALGISRAHVWKLESRGELPRPVRLGRAVRWSKKDIEEWLAAGAPSRDRWELMRAGHRRHQHR